jgi:integrase/recombinase XerD
MVQQNTVETTIKEYLIASRQAGRSPATQEKYGAHLQKLAHWLNERDITRLEQVNKALIREWGAELYVSKSARTGKCWSPATVKQAVCAARSFFKWCREEELVEQDLANALKLPKVENLTLRTLDILEAQQVLEACDDTLAGIRNRALISLMLDSGLRASEICRVQVSDLKFGMVLYDPMSGEMVEINFLTVLRKGGKIKPAYFGPETARYIEAWLEARQRAIKAGVNELFVSLGGTKPGTGLTRDGLRVIVRKLAQQAGIAHFSPHALRRSFACFLDAAGASSRKIQLFGGWSSIQEVETYTRGIQVGGQYPHYSPVSFLGRVRKALGP